MPLNCDSQSASYGYAIDKSDNNMLIATVCARMKDFLSKYLCINLVSIFEVIVVVHSHMEHCVYLILQ